MTELMENDIWADQAASHPGGQMLTKRMIQRALQGGWLTKHSRLLDLGCGSGETVKLLRSMDFQAEGIDLRTDKHEAYLVKETPPFSRGRNTFFRVSWQSVPYLLWTQVRYFLKCCGSWSRAVSFWYPIYLNSDAGLPGLKPIILNFCIWKTPLLV